MAMTTRRRALQVLASSGLVGVTGCSAFGDTAPAIKTGTLTPDSKIFVNPDEKNLGFGSSVSIHDDRVLVGAPGIVGSDDSTIGSAYRFDRTGDGWEMVRAFPAPDVKSAVAIGDSVSLNDELAVIGAPVSTTDNRYSSGAVGIFERTGDTYDKQSTVAPEGMHIFDFGNSVDVAGNTVVAGAWTSTVSQDGSSGNKLPDGKAFIIENIDGDWKLQSELISNEPQKQGYFGTSVAVSDTTVLVGSFGDRNHRGSAYIFERNDGSWIQTASITPDLPKEGTAGRAVALSEDGEWAFVNSWSVDNEETFTPGTVFVYRKRDDHWEKHGELSHQFDVPIGFGYSLAVSNNVVIVGSLGNDDADEPASGYLFQLEEGKWVRKGKLIADDGIPSEFVSFDAIDIDDTTVIVGSPYGKLTPESKPIGTAYIFDIGKDTGLF